MTSAFTWSQTSLLAPPPVTLSSSTGQAQRGELVDHVPGGEDAALQDRPAELVRTVFHGQPGEGTRRVGVPPWRHRAGQSRNEHQAPCARGCVCRAVEHLLLGQAEQLCDPQDAAAGDETAVLDERDIGYGVCVRLDHPLRVEDRQRGRGADGFGSPGDVDHDAGTYGRGADGSGVIVTRPGNDMAGGVESEPLGDILAHRPISAVASTIGGSSPESISYASSMRVDQMRSVTS